VKWPSRCSREIFNVVPRSVCLRTRRIETPQDISISKVDGSRGVRGLSAEHLRQPSATGRRDGRNPRPASIGTGGRFRSESLAGCGVICARCNQALEQVFLHDRENERGKQLTDPHASDLCLQDELADDRLIEG
jgi:hypothetical protein